MCMIAGSPLPFALAANTVAEKAASGRRPRATKVGRDWFVTLATNLLRPEEEEEEWSSRVKFCKKFINIKCQLLLT